ncbi:acyl-CoA dehydrogenase/oxidase [Thraustotheca clavata]|uniref:Acyl-CoA dehydrogenase/oxidase n=1 Tax=Thraustotheca clavata TaxID=74557 RepID=A0A1V9Z4V1_9STRA|nr:acyl-CoA dehydrogenase/oxidase [Thraustotheca clavata]
MNKLRALVMAHPVLSYRDMMYRNHTERYFYALNKAHANTTFIREHNITDPDEMSFIYGQLGEPLSIGVHRILFIPTLETQADDEQRDFWLPLAQDAKILGEYAD